MTHSYGPELVNLSETAVAKHGNVFAVTRRDGSLPVGEPHALGVYRDDGRHLSGHEVTLGGGALHLLRTTEGPGPVVVHELTNPPLPLGGGRELPVQSLRVRVERRVAAAGVLEERVEVTSYARGPLALPLEVRLAADFAPMLAVRGLVDPPPEPARAEATDDGVRFFARGRDGVLRETTVTADPAPDRAEADLDPRAAPTARLAFALDLPPGGRVEVVLRHELDSGAVAGPAAPPLPAPATVHLSDALAQRVVDRAAEDLRTLASELDGRWYLAAGVPWYATLFGRDSLVCALQVLPLWPEVAEGTLRLLAGRLGRREDPLLEEDPGKVLHELRLGEVAGAGLTPLARYFGSVDATPLWLCLLAEHARWTGGTGLLRELRPQVDAMLAWLDGPGDRDGDGLLDYAARARGGLRNQGWKDSEDGVCHEDGTPLEPPVALVEPQGYAIRARRGVAALLDRDGDAEGAARLRAAADAHAERLERFWLPDRGAYAMAIGGDGRPSRALASNMGHLLWAGVLPPERAGAVRDALLGDALFSGFGIRTLGAGQGAYNPVGYHLGTVWPHDTALIAAGLRAHGFPDAFGRVAAGLLDAAARSEHERLPELFAGFPRSEAPEPVPYPVACQPQAWAAGAVPQILLAGLGLEPDADAGTVAARDPWLPPGVDRATLRGLRVGTARVDLAFERGPDGTVARV